MSAVFSIKGIFIGILAWDGKYLWNYYMSNVDF